MLKRVKGILKGTFFSLIVTAMLAATLAAAMYFLDIPDSAAAILVFLIGAVSSAAGAYAVSRAAGTKGMGTGALVGLAYYFILAAASLIIRKELALDTHMIIMLAATIASGMFGGVMGVR